MKYLKIYGLNLIIMLSIFFILSFIMTILSYFDLIGSSITSIIEIVIMIITLFIGGFLTSIKTNNKGWLEGIKIAIIFIIVLLLINIIFIKQFNFKSIFYYLIITIPSILGGMIGNLKKCWQSKCFFVSYISVIRGIQWA